MGVGVRSFSFVVVSVRVSQDPPHMMVVGFLYLANLTFVTHDLGTVLTETAVGGIDANQRFPSFLLARLLHELLAITLLPCQFLLPPLETLDFMTCRTWGVIFWKRCKPSKV